MPLDTLEDVLAHDLSDLLSAENQFSKALKQVIKAADSAEVKQMAEEHLQETEGQIENLKQAFATLGQKPEKGLVCKAAQGIVEENSSTLKEEKPKGAIKDLVLACGSLKIEHYEIAGYTAAIATAKALGQREVAQLLQANLKQEQATAKKLEAGAQQILLLAKGGTAPTATAGATKAGATKSGGSKSGGSKGGSKSGGSKSGGSKGGASKNGGASDS